jgi:hypothetical protein
MTHRLIKAMKLKIGDVLSEGTTVTSLSRSGGHVYAKLDDGRRLICPDHYLLGVTRAPQEKGPKENLGTLIDVVPQKRI